MHFYEFPPRGKDYAARCTTSDGWTVHDYGDLVESARWFADDRRIPVYRASMLGWNDVRSRRKNGDFWLDFSPERFYLWNRINIRFLREHRRPEEQILLVHSWNDPEHETTALLPDRKYGYACLNSLSRAVFDLPFEETPDKDSLYYLGAGNLRM